MTKLYDRKDIGILVQTFNSIAPTSPTQRAMLLIDMAQHLGLSFTDIVHEVNRCITERRLQEVCASNNGARNVVVLPRIPYKD